MNDTYINEALPTILDSLVAGLEKLSKANDVWVTEDMFTAQCFVGDTIPDMPLADYVARCATYFKCSSSCFVVTCVYIDRLRSYNNHPAGLVIHSYNAHRIFLTALVLACKYTDDRVYKNNYYAQCGGVTMQALNESEILFLKMLDFDLGVETELFEEYARNMTKTMLIPEPVELLPLFELNIEELRAMDDFEYDDLNVTLGPCEQLFEGVGKCESIDIMDDDLEIFDCNTLFAPELCARQSSEIM